jgi:hypothetical protein
MRTEQEIDAMVQGIIEEAFSHEELQKIQSLGFTLCPQPLAFPVNEHGHYVIRVLDPSLRKKMYTTGDEEYCRLQQNGVIMDKLVASALFGQAKDSYDDKHRLKAGPYNVALVPAREAPDPGNIGQWRELGQKYGYQMFRRAGIMPLLLPELTNIRLAQMGFDYVTTFHNPFEVGCGETKETFVFGVTHRGDRQALVATKNIGPEARWQNKDVAIAFLVPDSE